MFSLLFQAPSTSIYTWAMMFGKLGWRQKFVFAMIPVFFQEVWRAKLSQGNKAYAAAPCSSTATQDEENFPFPAWIPTFANESKVAKPKAYRFVKRPTGG